MSHQPAIVVAAYNRPLALRGLLESLLQAHYPENTTLVVSIDGGGGGEVRALAEALVWPFGEKRIIHHPTNLGLKNHILNCATFAYEYGSVVLLEDDLEVAPTFYQYAQAALDKYAGEPTIAGISLYSYQIAESDLKRFPPFNDRHGAYLMQFSSSWGLAFTAQQWRAFTDWLEAHPSTKTEILPPYIQQWGAHSWKKRFVEYLLSTGQYFVFPSISFTTNKGYAGVHFARQLTLFEVPLHQGPMPTLPEVEEMLRYNVHFDMEAASQARLGLEVPPRSKSLPNVPLAEYRYRVAAGVTQPSWLGKLLFVASYYWHNYLNALLRKL